ncbi:hypothetical protein N9F57_03810 [Gammaproteobacteria bacterium]|nr:hypothetical protein [Gammaproteobacteria bacterium]
MPEKTSGKTPKTKNLPIGKNVKNNKNTALKKNELVDKIPKSSTAKDKPKGKNNEPKEAIVSWRSNQALNFRPRMYREL